jgi:hypothetical protein
VIPLRRPRLLSVKKRSRTSAWGRFTSSTRKRRARLGWASSWPEAAAAAGAAAVAEAAEAAVEAAAVAEVAAAAVAAVVAAAVAAVAAAVGHGEFAASASTASAPTRV